MVAKAVGGQQKFLAWVISLLFSSLVPTAWALHNSFDVREASIASIHHDLFRVSSFLARIEEFNQVINSIVSLNPDALADADRLDQTITQGNVTGAQL
ncbi:hypothetical protein N0V88_003560 [Collariella sp. IMI 366227]|nr:hypothetical protein N0V88_003560 [Collariella sp. IMI 366227]